MFDVVVDLGAVWLGSSSSTSSSFSDTFVSYLETTEDKESGGPVVRFGWKDVAPFVGTFVYYVYSVPATKCRALVYGRISNSCKSVSYLIWKIGVVTFKSFNMPSWLNPPPPPPPDCASKRRLDRLLFVGSKLIFSISTCFRTKACR